jgi:shikimate kinase
MPLWLIEMMGSSKTTAGRLAADSLGVPFFDTDEEVASRLGRPVAAIWDDLGESSFREMESAAVRQLAGERAVISTAGGIVLEEGNREVTKTSGPVVWLSCPPEVLASRLEGSSGRPLLDGEPELAAAIGDVLAKRSSVYSEIADFEIDTSALSVEEVAVRIEGLWPS